MAKFIIDAAHSEASFKIKHLMISTVSGQFNEFEGEATTTGEGFEGATVRFSADVNSINTKNEQRDGHLKSADFFDAAQYPKISFESTSFTKNGDDYVLEGNLTVKDVTKPVSLAVEYNGTMTDFYGQKKHGFEVNGKINRKEFGLTWHAVTEAGGVVVSDEVKLHFNIQLTEQA
jgi:polyisoprenoid-binding protein YceI